MFILWGLWIYSTTTEPWLKMRAHIKDHIKSKLISKINLDSIFPFQSRYVGQKSPNHLPAFPVRLHFIHWTTLFNFLKVKMQLACAKLTATMLVFTWQYCHDFQCPNNILVLWHCWSPHATSNRGVQSLNIQLFFSPHISSSAGQISKNVIANLSTPSHIICSC